MFVGFFLTKKKKKKIHYSLLVFVLLVIAWHCAFIILLAFFPASYYLLFSFPYTVPACCYLGHQAPACYLSLQAFHLSQPLSLLSPFFSSRFMSTSLILSFFFYFCTNPYSLCFCGWFQHYLQTRWLPPKLSLFLSLSLSGSVSLQFSLSFSLSLSLWLILKIAEQLL